MHLQELPQYVAIDIQEALEERFMESEAMYVRFLRKLLTTDDYRLMEEAAAAENWQEVLRYAHNLKGVCATLGLTGLQAQFADIVSLLRSEKYIVAQLQAKLAAVKHDWQRTLQYIECMMEILSVAVGGALGAVCRYLLGNFISRMSGSALPWGTFAINIIGCFCMGLLMTLIVERGLLPAAWRLFLCVGLLGGFTTFSTFGYESLMLLTEGNIAAAAAYSGGSLLLGLLAAGAGVLAGKGI